MGITLVVAIFLICVLWSLLSVWRSLYPSRHPIAESKKLLSASEHALTAPDGAVFVVHAFVPKQPKAAVLMVHGYYANKHQVADVAFELSERGIAAFLVELRGHGSRPGPFTFGREEVGDVQTAVRWIELEYPSLPIHLLGWSMGAAIICQSALDLPQVKSVITDCLFDHLFPLMKRRVSEAYFLPGFMAYFTWWGLQFYLREDLERVQPRYCAQLSEKPLLAMHGGQDARAFIEEGKAFYAQWKGPKQWWQVDSAAHVALYENNPTGYLKKVTDFILKYSQ